MILGASRRKTAGVGGAKKRLAKPVMKRRDYFLIKKVN